MTSILRFFDEWLVNVYAKNGVFEKIWSIWKGAVQFGKKILKLDSRLVCPL